MWISKEWLGIISVAITLASLMPYLYYTLKRRIKPHAFSWIIWALLTAIGFAAQYSENAGPGAWATAAACVACTAIAVLSLFYGERQITRSDWAAFFTGLAAI